MIIIWEQPANNDNADKTAPVIGYWPTNMGCIIWREMYQSG